jgi:hypothetical protein
MNIKWTDEITKNYGESPSRNSDKKKKMEFDWTHITYRSRSNTDNRIRLESSGVHKKRQAEENMAKDSRGRNKKYRKIM